MNRWMKLNDEMMDSETETIEYVEYDAEAIEKEIKNTMTYLLAGIGVLAALFLVAGLLIVSDKPAWCMGILIGTLGAVIMAVHLSVTLQNQMDMDTKSGNKYMVKNTMLRFIFMAVLIFISLKVSGISLTGLLLGILTLKISALVQPYINKKLS